MPRRLSVASGIEVTGDRAAFLPSHGVLVIADVHVGYARAARRRGGWLPTGEDAAACAERALAAARAVGAAHLVV